MVYHRHPEFVPELSIWQEFGKEMFRNKNICIKHGRNKAFCHFANKFSLLVGPIEDQQGSPGSTLKTGGAR